MLAKRKTALMKEMEAAKRDKERLKRQRQLKRERVTRQMQLLGPEHSSFGGGLVDSSSTADFERQLRKLATRGGESTDSISRYFELRLNCYLIFRLVVALFNAISKSKKETSSPAVSQEHAAVATVVRKETLSRQKSEKKANTDDSVGVESSWAALRDDYMMLDKTLPKGTQDKAGSATAGKKQRTFSLKVLIISSI